jgi:arylsulfatase A-like enzyme
VIVDTIRTDRTGLLGAATTPRLDAWGARGQAHTQAVAPSSWTLPSVAAILAGRELRANHKRRPADWELLPQRFAAAGYATAAVVANPVLAKDAGFAEAFDSFEVTELAPWSVDEVLQRADAWLARPRTGPRFLYLHVMEPHTPYAEPAAEPVPGWSDGAAAVDWTPTAEQAVCVGRWRRAYDGQVAAMDARLGPWLQRWEGLSALVGDHGEGLFSHALPPGTRNRARFGPPGCKDMAPGYDDHGLQRHEEAIRVPLWVVGPGVAAERVEAPARAIDLAATLLVLAGAEGPSPLGQDTPAFGIDKGGAYVRVGGRKLLREAGDVVVPVGVAMDATAEVPVAEPEVAAKLAALLDAWQSGAAAPEGPSKETQEALKRLGYIDD